MNNLEPVSVMLKFGFLIVLYLFLLWVSRSALRDLRGGGTQLPDGPRQAPAPPADATGLHSASSSVRRICSGVHLAWLSSARRDTSRA